LRLSQILVKQRIAETAKAVKMQLRLDNLIVLRN
jgi:hypothetical protein